MIKAKMLEQKRKVARKTAFGFYLLPFDFVCDTLRYTLSENRVRRERADEEMSEVWQ